MKYKNRISGSLVGHFVGDALGVPHEFCTRDSLKVAEMESGGFHGQDKGVWSDDTSMTLATMFSLRFGLDYKDIGKKYCEWVYDNEFTATGEVFDVGGTTYIALGKIKRGISVRESGCLDIMSNGNGSLMRMLPIVHYLYFKDGYGNKYNIIDEFSSITHAHDVSVIACCIYAEVCWNILDGYGKIESISKAFDSVKEYFKYNQYIDRFKNMFDNLLNFKENDIKSTGYVVDTLEASLWCFLRGDNYKGGVLKAVNLGDDTDTIGAVTGSLLGLYYGYDNIPKEWISELKRKEYLLEQVEKFIDSIK